MFCRGAWILIALSLFVFSRHQGLAQQIIPQDQLDIEQGLEIEGLDDGDFNFGESLLTLFFPRGVRDTWRLKRYIRSEKFCYVKSRAGDLWAIDAIYGRAMEVTHGDVSEALFISGLATMEHSRVGVRLPLIKLPLYFPLTTEGDSAFGARVFNLPSHFYSDSPPGEYGDRDKLQHFFGSAFLAYSFRSRGLASFIGAFVEWGENEFIIDGAPDPRDRRANHQGQEFGFALADRSEAKPSEFLQIQLVLSGSRLDW
jgi:hypothetical protein